MSRPQAKEALDLIWTIGTLVHKNTHTKYSATYPPIHPPSTHTHTHRGSVGIDSDQLLLCFYWHFNKTSDGKSNKLYTAYE